MNNSKSTARRLIAATIISSAIAIIVGCTARHDGQRPPFTRLDGTYSPRTFYRILAGNPNLAQSYKGNIFCLLDVPPGPLITDASGEKYIVVYSLPDAGNPAIPKDGIRCYLDRPNAPILEHYTGRWDGSRAYNVTGMYVGKIGNIIVLRKCYLSETFGEGPVQ